ncbi:hypothetical protein Zmor_024040 [Zophobas morio]|uniref:Tyr recombinase domain-containing protein n=1 Tax=Zophobas morio TaxID=2755281 RepID=A0AA38I264_9CUCU|nr:hypothetical protein Zmor_024040 [Zophobas morio]
MQNPAHITEKAKEIVLDLLPAKSPQMYEKEYQIFLRWKEEKKIVVVNEDVVLNYLHEKSQEVKPSTLWSKYSMIKAVLSVKENIEINKFSRVIAFLKRNSVGYEPTKSKVLTRQEIDTFLTNADDMKYLLIKVALLFGVCGACRREELHSLKIQDIVQKDEECLIITIPDTKSNIKRVFPVIAKDKAVNGL